MFNFKKEERKPREYKGETIYLTKYNNVDTEKFLDIIVRCIESYVRQKGIMPEKLRLSYENYNRILEYNKNLIEQRNEKYYTFGVEIEI